MAFASAKRQAASVGAFALAAVFSACRQDMHDQPRFKAYGKSDFYEDRRSARPLPEGTVARGQLREDAPLYTGKHGKEFAAAFPFEITAAVVARGRERFNVYCSPCHGRTGAGNGMVVQRGFKQPPSYHIDRLRQAPHGYFFDVITSGFGAMQDYAAQIPVADRWAIVAYIRALQYSQHASIEDVPVDKRGELTAAPKPAAEAGAHRGGEAHR
jgi:mono/diheme cytochrome c family protein